jgi:hypothetical protein
MSDRHEVMQVRVRFFDHLRRIVVIIERKGSYNLAKSGATAVDQSSLGQAPKTKLKGVSQKRKEKLGELLCGGIHANLAPGSASFKLYSAGDFGK